MRPRRNTYHREAALVRDGDIDRAGRHVDERVLPLSTVLDAVRERQARRAAQGLRAEITT